MSNCRLCGTQKPQKICNECGCQWDQTEVLDQPDKVKSFCSNLYRVIVASDQDPETEQLRKMRLRMKISYGTYRSIFSDLISKLEVVDELRSFKLEFNDNVVEAYAGQDTMLQFKFTNLQDSGEQFKSAKLFWDDPDTPDNLDFHAKSQSLIESNAEVILQNSHVFQRSGPKSIDSMVLTVENLYDQSSDFFVDSFTFRVLNPVQQVVNYNTNNTSVNVEGRVVDMSGLSAGSSAQPSNQPESKAPRWIELNVRPKILPPDDISGFIGDHEEPQEPPEQATPVIEEQDEVDAATDESITDTQSPQSESVVPVVNSNAKSNNKPVTLRESVEVFFKYLATLASISPAATSNNVIYSADFSLEFLDNIFSLIPDLEEDAILGMTFADGNSVMEDDNECVNNFDGIASVVTLSGVTIIECENSVLTHSVDYAWAEVHSMGWNFIKRRFGENSYLISFGSSTTGEILPGCKFDLRRYEGELSLEQLVDVAGMYYLKVVELSPTLDQVNASLEDDDSEEEFEETDDLEFEEEEEENDDEGDSAAHEAAVSEIQSLMNNFFVHFGFAMQKCLENQPKSIFVSSQIDPNFLSTLFEAASEAGSGMQVVCLEPQHAELSSEGKLVGWQGSASVLSAEGIFHMARAQDGEYQLEGSNCFLSWKKLFNDYNSSLILRELGPDLWIGSETNVLIRGAYADFSGFISQWDYFLDFVQKDLVSSFEKFKESTTLI